MLNIFDFLSLSTSFSPFPLPPPRINFYYKFSVFPSGPFFIHFKDLSGGRKVFVLLTASFKGFCEFHSLENASDLPASWFVVLCSGFGRTEVATTAVAGTTLCSELRLVIVQGQLKTLPGILFPEP